MFVFKIITLIWNQVLLVLQIIKYFYIFFFLINSNVLLDLIYIVIILHDYYLQNVVKRTNCSPLNNTNEEVSVINTVPQYVNIYSQLNIMTRKQIILFKNNSVNDYSVHV